MKGTQSGMSGWDQKMPLPQSCVLEKSPIKGIYKCEIFVKYYDLFHSRPFLIETMNVVLEPFLIRNYRVNGENFCTL